MVKHVILDVGGVLLSFNPQVPLDAFCKTEEEKAIIRKELFESGYWHEADAGHIKDADLYELVRQKVAPEHHAALKQCCDHWDICMKPLAGAREFCQWLKSKGFGVYVLSNTSDRFYTYFGSFLPLDFFDGIIISSDIKLMKPSHEIFQYVVDKYGLEKTECLFVDDGLKNVEGARSFGMQAQQYTGDFEEIKKYL